MKKWIALLLTVTMLFSLVACGNNSGINTESQSENNTSSETEKENTET
jgi:predicted small lipoprotein YifL